jgi:hypothetical protein
MRLTFNFNCWKVRGLWLWYLSQFYMWRKPEYPEKTSDLPQVTDKLDHMSVNFWKLKNRYLFHTIDVYKNWLRNFHSFINTAKYFCYMDLIKQFNKILFFIIKKCWLKDIFFQILSFFIIIVLKRNPIIQITLLHVRFCICRKIIKMLNSVYLLQIKNLYSC